MSGMTHCMCYKVLLHKVPMLEMTRDKTSQSYMSQLPSRPRRPTSIYLHLFSLSMGPQHQGFITSYVLLCPCSYFRVLWVCVCLATLALTWLGVWSIYLQNLTQIKLIGSAPAIRFYFLQKASPMSMPWSLHGCD
jgi:hypothetical protein